MTDMNMTREKRIKKLVTDLKAVELLEEYKQFEDWSKLILENIREYTTDELLSHARYVIYDDCSKRGLSMQMGVEYRWMGYAVENMLISRDIHRKWYKYDDSYATYIHENSPQNDVIDILYDNTRKGGKKFHYAKVVDGVSAYPSYGTWNVIARTKRSTADAFLKSIGVDFGLSVQEMKKEWAEFYNLFTNKKN